MRAVFIYIEGFIQGWHKAGRLLGISIRHDRWLRTHLSETQIDHMLEDSFPASDPPSTY